MIMADDDGVIEGYAKLSDELHTWGTAVFGQLFHPGREILEEEDGLRQVAVAPSAVMNERGRVMPRSLRLDEIEEIVENYGRAAARLRSGGLDGVEIVASHGYLISQFLNPVTNQREDKYGGDEERRARFLGEVATRVRRVDPEMAVGIRVSLDERDPYGLAKDVIIGQVRTLAEAGLIDYVSVTTGTSASLGGSDHIAPDMSWKNGYLADDSARLRALLPRNVAVMVAGRVNQPQEAERILEEGSADFVGMTRALICDPIMPLWAAAGAVEEIRACVGCNQACIGHFQKGVAISCIQHPESGRESAFSLVRITTGKSALVIGGGPGGLKAAAALAERGVSVELFEREAVLGGQVGPASMLPGREEFGGVTQNLAREAERAGALIRCRREVSADEDFSEYDLVVVATGAQEEVAPLEVVEGAFVYSASAVLGGAELSPGRVVVADFSADWIGGGVGLWLAQRGREVVLVESGACAGEALQQYVRDEMVKALARARVEVACFTRVFGVDSGAAYVQHVLTKETRELECGAVVSAGWRRGRSELLDALVTLGVNAVGIGDCMGPRSVEEAVYEGLLAAADNPW
jgi:2,4-dienoyl-CoA reductase-like NADH-dependent reductase (Old Yellow Enzyme family)